MSLLLLAAWLLPTRFLCLASEAKRATCGLSKLPPLKNFAGSPQENRWKLGFTITPSLRDFLEGWLVGGVSQSRNMTSNNSQSNQLSFQRPFFCSRTSLLGLGYTQGDHRKIHSKPSIYIYIIFQEFGAR